MKSEIPFNKPYHTGIDAKYIYQAINSNHISGNGLFTKKCHEYFEKRYEFKKCLLTTSCTDALEMAAILIDVKPGDEIIMPSFTFVSTANAFILRGAKIVFADSEEITPNIDVNKLEPLITSKTKAIVTVHYAGVACKMNRIMELANKYNLFVVEDAAQAIDSYFRKRPLGSLGHLATFSFHETKNIISGEGGMLVVNDERFIERSEIIWEKGTNRVAYWRHEIDKYNWVDIGSSFLPSDIVAAFLYGQLEQLDNIQGKRKKIWNQYYKALQKLQETDLIKLPHIPEYASNNAHMFYIQCKDINERTHLIRHLKENRISAVFHYLSLHNSPFYKKKHDGRELPFCDYYSDCLLRLPFYNELSDVQITYVVDSINSFYVKG